MGHAARDRIAAHFSEGVLLEKLSEITLGRPNIFRPKRTETIQVRDLIERLQGSEADRAARLEVINKQARDFEEKIVALKASMRWKITGPFRWTLYKWNSFGGHRMLRDGASP